RTIVEAVEVRQRLKIGLVLDQLFGSAMEQTHMRINPLDCLAIQFHDHTQHTVCSRVLRPEIDRVVGDDIIASRRRLFKAQAVHSASPFLSSIAGGSAGVFSEAALSVFAPAPVSAALSVVLGFPTAGGAGFLDAFSSPGKTYSAP